MTQRHPPEGGDENLLSFLDLLTCSMIGMMVLAIILAVAMATGGSLFIQPTNPVVQSALSPLPKGVGEDPLFAIVDIYIANVVAGERRPEIARWSASGAKSRQRSSEAVASEMSVRVLATESTLDQQDGSPFHSSFRIIGQPDVSHAEVTVTIKNMPAWQWGEVNSFDLPAVVEPCLGGLDLEWVYAIRREVLSGLPEFGGSFLGEWRERLREGGLSPVGDVESLWVDALAWCVVGRAYRPPLAIDLPLDRKGETLAFMDIWRYEPLEAFLNEIAIGSGLAGTFPERIPLALFMVRTNHSSKSWVWIPRGCDGSLKTADTLVIRVSPGRGQVSFE